MSAETVILWKSDVVFPIVKRTMLLEKELLLRARGTWEFRGRAPLQETREEQEVRLEAANLLCHYSK